MSSQASSVADLAESTDAAAMSRSTAVKAPQASPERLTMLRLEAADTVAKRLTQVGRSIDHLSQHPCSPKRRFGKDLRHRSQSATHLGPSTGSYRADRDFPRLSPRGRQEEVHSTVLGGTTRLPRPVFNFEKREACDGVLKGISMRAYAEVNPLGPGHYTYKPYSQDVSNPPNRPIARSLARAKETKQCGEVTPAPGDYEIRSPFDAQSRETQRILGALPRRPKCVDAQQFSQIFAACSIARKGTGRPPHLRVKPAGGAG